MGSTQTDNWLMKHDAKDPHAVKGYWNTEYDRAMREAKLIQKPEKKKPDRVNSHKHVLG